MTVMKITIIMILCWPSPVCHEESISYHSSGRWRAVLRETNSYGSNVTIPVYLVICMHLYHHVYLLSSNSLMMSMSTYVIRLVEWRSVLVRGTVSVPLPLGVLFDCHYVVHRVVTLHAISQNCMQLHAKCNLHAKCKRCTKMQCTAYTNKPLHQW